MLWARKFVGEELTMKPEQQTAYDHAFRAIHDDEIP
jgi:hypothetical protein